MNTAQAQAAGFYARFSEQGVDLSYGDGSNLRSILSAGTTPSIETLRPSNKSYAVIIQIQEL